MEPDAPIVGEHCRVGVLDYGRNHVRGEKLMRTRSGLPLVTLLLGVLVACHDVAAPTQLSVLQAAASESTPSAAYVLEDLGVLPTGYASSAYRINNLGDVAGSSNVVDSAGLTHGHPVLWIGSQAIDLGLPFGPSTTEASAWDVNDRRTVVGFGSTSSGEYLGFMWSGGTFVTIAAGVSPRNVIVLAVNNSDVAAGSYRPVPAGSDHAFRWSVAGGFVDIHPTAYVRSWVRGISDAGEIVGSVYTAAGEEHAGLWSAVNTFTDLGTLSGPSGYSSGWGINNSGVVVGASTLTPYVNAFTWTRGAGMRSAGRDARAADISDRGRVVGNHPYFTPSVAVTKRGSTPAQILPLLPGGSSAWATGVNRCGSIAGNANVASGFFHAVRWRIAACD